MTLVIDALIIIILFLLFGYSHSILASNKLKKKLAEQIGSKIAFYRLFYNTVSVIVFIILYAIAPKPSVIIYDLNYPWDIVILIVQFFSLIGLIWAASGVKLWEFIGFAQIKRYYTGTYNPKELDERYILKKTGAFKYSRHPIYFFTILFLGFRPTMDFFYLVFFICLTGYFIIGSIYEEKKLVELFGDEYVQYQKNTSRLVPLNFFKDHKRL